MLQANGESSQTEDRYAFIYLFINQNGARASPLTFNWGGGGGDSDLDIQNQLGRYLPQVLVSPQSPTTLFRNCLTI